MKCTYSPSIIVVPITILGLWVLFYIEDLDINVHQIIVHLYRIFKHILYKAAIVKHPLPNIHLLPEAGLDENIDDIDYPYEYEIIL